jgi:hypothetical protein
VTAEDFAILHVLLATGAKAAAVDGTSLAWCRMYSGGSELVDGYTKWLSDWIDTPRKIAWSVGMIGLVQVLPPAAALRGSRIGLLGYLAAVAGRAVVARRFAEPAMWSLTHPVGCLMSAGMIVESKRRKTRKLATWKGRSL